MLKLAREVYPDFNMGHCLEMLAERDNLMTSYATFHRWCRMAGIAKLKPDVSVHVYEDGSISPPALNRRDVA